MVDSLNMPFKATYALPPFPLVEVSTCPSASTHQHHINDFKTADKNNNYP